MFAKARRWVKASLLILFSWTFTKGSRSKTAAPTATFWTLGPLDPEKERTSFAKLKSYIDKKKLHFTVWESLTRLTFAQKKLADFFCKRADCSVTFLPDPFILLWRPECIRHLHMETLRASFLPPLKYFCPFWGKGGGITSLHLFEQLSVIFLNATTTHYLWISGDFFTFLNKVISWSCLVCIWLIAI